MDNDKAVEMDMATLTSSDSTQEESPLRTKLKTTVKSLDTIISNFSDRKRRCSQPPVGMEKPFHELYYLLHPCLVGRQEKANRAALVMGMRGSGKTLLVEHTIDCLAREQCHFRVVRLNGLVIRGDDVGFAVKEIIRQLSDIAMMESAKDNILSPGREKKMNGLLRLRKSSFTSNLALLDEVLRMACIDGIPILIVLDEFDALLGTSASPVGTNFEGGAQDRQLLLYHLLDRVTTQGTCLCLVAITSHLAAVSMLEKRVKSRTEGASKVIYIRDPTYESLVKILLNKLEIEDIRERVSDIISSLNDKDQRIQLILERNQKLGKDLRWFCRVVSCAIALYREDCQSMLRQPNDPAHFPQLSQDHFLHALVVMNASFANESRLENVGVDPRMQALLDLSGPQVALVLAARRILAREVHTEDTTPKPLTLQRMLQEYQSYRGSQRYNDRLLRQCFLQLLETDVMRPSADHTGGGPLQYGYSKNFYAMDFTTMSRMPLHLPVDIDRELGEVLKNDLLECSTALREWGKKKN